MLQDLLPGGRGSICCNGGAFDITVAPVVNAWGFGFTERSRVDSALIDSLLQFVGMSKVSLRENKLVREREGMMLDMNAIAQGYAVDVLAGFFDAENIENYLVEIGGEVRCSGKNRFGLDWRIGIDKPIDGLQLPGVQMQAIVQISGRSLATSGNYRRFYEEDGIKYSHTIDPSTGYPVQHGLLSATVVASDCMRADAYATAFMVMGYEKARRFLEKHTYLDAYLIFNDEMG
ncbi:MAG: FAD:protein FMN transferase, partial [Bacteroidales bacterium]|nr:FAD:protein FMN transferase [Bacteroidales bacterium]